MNDNKKIYLSIFGVFIFSWLLIQISSSPIPSLISQLFGELLFWMVLGSYVLGPIFLILAIILEVHRRKSLPGRKKNIITTIEIISIALFLVELLGFLGIMLGAQLL